KQYTKLFAIDNVELTFEKEALNAIAAKALARKTGVRALRAILEEIMGDVMYELPEYSGYEVIITKEVVDEATLPVYIKKTTQKSA
ncbi:MAG: ATP-dependent Clp protease ATP-binding subunit ClpX, partial [Sulfuricurvum sp.]|nr:ATP-dependent Clp protease ATP-binding subunit ClpX [Sulfuricurvum sp.]